MYQAQHPALHDGFRAGLRPAPTKEFAFKQPVDIYYIVTYAGLFYCRMLRQ